MWISTSPKRNCHLLILVENHFCFLSAWLKLTSLRAIRRAFLIRSYPLTKSGEILLNHLLGLMLGSLFHWVLPVNVSRQKPRFTFIYLSFACALKITSYLVWNITPVLYLGFIIEIQRTVCNIFGSDLASHSHFFDKASLRLFFK